MSAAAELADRAAAMLGPDCALGLVSDADTYADRGVVLLAVARPGASCVLRIPAASYCGLRVLELAGLLTDEPPPRPDPETLLKEHHARRR